MTYIPDIYSGVNYIAPNNYGGLAIDGVLVINGDLILK